MLPIFDRVPNYTLLLASEHCVHGTLGTWTLKKNWTGWIISYRSGVCLWFNWFWMERPQSTSCRIRKKQKYFYGQTGLIRHGTRRLYSEKSYSEISLVLSPADACNSYLWIYYRRFNVTESWTNLKLRARRQVFCLSKVCGRFNSQSSLQTSILSSARNFYRA